MTPFELSLENDLHIEWQNFANNWLFKWHGMTYEGGVTDVDDFRGGRIHYGGIAFGNQQQQIFWQCIERYLIQKIHEIFKRWDAEVARYSPAIRLTSIDGVERHVRVFIHKINALSLETDRRLRGQGYPQSVEQFNSAPQVSRAEAELGRLAHAHRLLLEGEVKQDLAKGKPLLLWKWLEDFYANNRGLIWLVGILITVSGIIYRLFSGG